MELRLAAVSDLEDIMGIVSDAREFLKANGVDQWQDGYPEESVFEEDIRNSNCFVAEDNGKAVGVISVLIGEDVCYNIIEDGNWLTYDTVYGSFHRFAVRDEYRGKGVAKQLLSLAEDVVCRQKIKSIRGDTHSSNKSMRGLMEKRGYASCGTVFVECEQGRDRRRTAYEKILTD